MLLRKAWMWLRGYRLTTLYRGRVSGLLGAPKDPFEHVQAWSEVSFRLQLETPQASQTLSGRLTPMDTADLFYWPPVTPKRAWTRRLGVAAGFLVGASMLCTGVALAWPSPGTDAMGGACQGGQRTPITWFVFNLETSNPGSPATITNVVVSGGFGVTAFTPQPLANTGTAYATATTFVPPSFEGNVTLNYMMVWSGTDGTDSRTGSTVVHVNKCEAPTTTTTVPSTTPTTVPQTTTTVIPTTTTQAPSSTSTSTTVAPTTSTTAKATVSPSTTSMTPAPPTTAAPVLVPPMSIVRPTELPVTGSETVPLVLIACGSIIFGLMALYEARRRSSES